MSDRSQTILWALGVYLFALLFQGYQFGGQDQIEVLSIFQYWKHDGTLYPFDFYIQSFVDKSLTERTPYLILTYLLTFGNPWLVFLLHMMTSLVLFTGIIQIGQLLGGSRFIGVLTAMVVVSIGSYTHLGGNEIYYNYLIPSLMAKAAGIWAIWFWLKHAPTLSFVLLALATYLQPLVGIQLFLILMAVDVFNRRSAVDLALQGFIYIVLTGPWIILLISQQGNIPLDTTTYFEIIEFRVGHHFFPHYFGFVNYLVFLPMMLATWFIEEKRIRYFGGIVAGGMLTYALLTMMIEIPSALNTQWFKTSLWIELFGIMAVIICFRDKFQIDLQRLGPIMTVGLLCLASLVNILNLKSPPFQPPLGEISSSEGEISQWAKTNTSKDALFVLPLQFSYFKTLAERSSFVDFKTMIHHHDYMRTYYKRIQSIYGIDLLTRRQLGMSEMLKEGNRFAARNFEKLGKAEVNYLISPIKLDSRQAIYQTESTPRYYVYSVDDPALN